jgi:hypothetical protein
VIEAVIERRASIDVGKKFVLVCVMTGDAKERTTDADQEVRHGQRLQNLVRQLPHPLATVIVRNTLFQRNLA